MSGHGRPADRPQRLPRSRARRPGGIPGSGIHTNAAGNLVSEKLWNLTGPGLEAAATVLDRPVRELGGTARGAARPGAKHAVKATDTITAFLQTPPEPTRPATLVCCRRLTK
ncbi:hypothetical protein [Streptomyces sp. NPDC048637]|uniref:hypothetical protein n=1 Tax=Streptomyces sp. NPDC048637 TaxID=3155636 RepID=UPI00343404D1